MELVRQDQQLETWKDIPGYYGLYRVSTHGRVKSMERLVYSQGKMKIVRARILRPGIDKDGYYSVQLSKDGFQKNERVHRLVATAFVRNPDRLPLVNHIDNNPKNNFYLNLEWTTPLGNMQHSARQGRKVAKNRKLTAEQAFVIKAYYAVGNLTMDEIAAVYGVTRPVIGNIVNNKTYKNEQRNN